MPDAELSGWLRLALVPGLGGQGLRKLLGDFGLPSRVLAAGRAALARSVGDALAERILADDSAAAVDAALRWVEAPDRSIVTLADAAYPQQLLEISDPPALLYVLGDAALLARRGLAIVGSRNATPQGTTNAERFARAFSDAGLTIASGLALGIDAAAHRGALGGAGSTVAVLGCGVDVVYPQRNADLYQAVAARGALVSEFPLGSPPLAANFPRRNRLISGLARGVLVVEAALAPGEQGRDVFAIPGSIHSPLSKGCHKLIREGAKLVETAQDVLEELGLAPPGLQSEGRAPMSDSAVLKALGGDPADVDTLVARTGLPAAEVAAELTNLEIAGD
ncbi:MAG: DNA-processing protein DprA, partial [Burkholderiales bacterium]